MEHIENIINNININNYKEIHNNIQLLLKYIKNENIKNNIWKLKYNNENNIYKKINLIYEKLKNNNEDNIDITNFIKEYEEIYNTYENELKNKMHNFFKYKIKPVELTIINNNNDFNIITKYIDKPLNKTNLLKLKIIEKEKYEENNNEYNENIKWNNTDMYDELITEIDNYKTKKYEKYYKYYDDKLKISNENEGNIIFSIYEIKNNKPKLFIQKINNKNKK